MITCDKLIETVAKVLGGDRYGRVEALRAIRAIEAAGWKIVGRDSTQEMRCATHRMHMHCGIAGMWQTMFDAAPQIRRRPMKLLAVVAATITMFMLQSFGRTLYVNFAEFEPAKTAWHKAEAAHDLHAMQRAYREEEIAHCRTIDPFWFYSPWANKCDLGDAP